MVMIGNMIRCSSACMTTTTSRYGADSTRTSRGWVNCIADTESRSDPVRRGDTTGTQTCDSELGTGRSALHRRRRRPIREGPKVLESTRPEGAP